MKTYNTSCNRSNNKRHCTSSPAQSTAEMWWLSERVNLQDYIERQNDDGEVQYGTIALQLVSPSHSMVARKTKDTNHGCQSHHGSHWYHVGACYQYLTNKPQIDHRHQDWTEVVWQGKKGKSIILLINNSPSLRTSENGKFFDFKNSSRASSFTAHQRLLKHTRTSIAFSYLKKLTSWVIKFNVLSLRPKWTKYFWPRRSITK